MYLFGAVNTRLLGTFLPTFLISLSIKMEKNLKTLQKQFLNTPRTHLFQVAIDNVSYF